MVPSPRMQLDRVQQNAVCFADSIHSATAQCLTRIFPLTAGMRFPIIADAPAGADSSQIIEP
jgi:hypothetical protein